MRLTDRFAGLAVLVLATGCGGAAAIAQNLPSGNGIAGGGFAPVVKSAPLPPSQLAAPPALPGAARHGTAAPATTPATDMPPTEALFDAINRGDIGGARDALSRGADIEGHNVLGMTPIELSVDLSRNDITFLLLSMRGAVPKGPPANALAANAAPDKQPKIGRHARGIPAQRETQISAEVRATRPLPEAGAGLPPASVRYAGSNPGTAAPQAGFLGF